MNTRASKKPQVVVALGSNLGDSVSIVKSAIDRLSGLAASGFQASSLWRTAPVDCPPDSPPFINAVALFEPREGETPESLLDKLMKMEKDFGRVRGPAIREPRRLDLDLVLFGDETRRTRRLTLPHPEAARRAFVLVPLNELAPELIFPGGDRTVRHLKDDLPPESFKGLERAVRPS